MKGIPDEEEEDRRIEEVYNDLIYEIRQSIDENEQKKLCGKVFNYSEELRVCEVGTNLNLLEEMIEIITKCNSRKIFLHSTSPKSGDVIIGCHNRQEAVDVLLKHYMKSKSSMISLIYRYECENLFDLEETIEIDDDTEIYYPLFGLDQAIYINEMKRFEPYSFDYSSEKETLDRINTIKMQYSRLDDFVSLNKILTVLTKDFIYKKNYRAEKLYHIYSLIRKAVENEKEGQEIFNDILKINDNKRENSRITNYLFKKLDYYRQKIKFGPIANKERDLQLRLNISFIIDNIVKIINKKAFISRWRSLTDGFYPKNEFDLRLLLVELFKDKKFGPGAIPKPQNKKRTVIGGISPQAGLMFSGYASANTFFQLFNDKLPDTVIILAPDFTGVYEDNAIICVNDWDMPFGSSQIDSDLASEIIKNSESFKLVNESTYRYHDCRHNHSIELQLAFTNFFSLDIKVLPIIIPSRLSFEEINNLAVDLHKVIEEANKDIIIIASASMFHASSSESDKYKELDQVFIRKFSKFKIKEAFTSLLNTPNNGTTTIPLLMLLCKYLGAKRCRALKYYTTDELEIMDSDTHYSVAYFSGILRK